MLEKNSKAGHDYLVLVGKEMRTWSHFLTNNRCNLFCNNIFEAWNKYIMEARDEPEITMLEMQRMRLTVRFQTKRKFLQNHIEKHSGRGQVLLMPKI